MSRALDLTGQRFGRLIVLERAVDRQTIGGETKRQWLCRCDCGKLIVASTMNLRKGDTKSCGCLKDECTKGRMTQHGESGTRLHNIWKAMRKRCRNERNSDYAYYGGRGIHVCTDWDESYEAFRDWAYKNGYEDGLTIDRIDVDRDYEPENCRFVDMKTQCNNRSNSRLITFNGETHTIAEWSEITGIKYHTLYMRIEEYGWTPERAFNN